MEKRGPSPAGPRIHIVHIRRRAGQQQEEKEEEDLFLLIEFTRVRLVIQVKAYVCTKAAADRISNDETGRISRELLLPPPSPSSLLPSQSLLLDCPPICVPGRVLLPLAL